jgi:type I restriction enzyme M protein
MLVNRSNQHRHGNLDLSVKNPNGGDEVTLRTPQEILDEIAALDAESTDILTTIRNLL